MARCGIGPGLTCLARQMHDLPQRRPQCIDATVEAVLTVGPDSSAESRGPRRRSPRNPVARGGILFR